MSIILATVCFMLCQNLLNASTRRQSNANDKSDTHLPPAGVIRRASRSTAIRPNDEIPVEHTLSPLQMGLRRRDGPDPVYSVVMPFLKQPWAFNIKEVVQNSQPSSESQRRNDDDHSQFGDLDVIIKSVINNPANRNISDMETKIIQRIKAMYGEGELTNDKFRKKLRRHLANIPAVYMREQENEEKINFVKLISHLMSTAHLLIVSTRRPYESVCEAQREKFQVIFADPSDLDRVCAQLAKFSNNALTDLQSYGPLGDAESIIPKKIVRLQNSRPVDISPSFIYENTIIFLELEKVAAIFNNQLSVDDDERNENGASIAGNTYIPLQFLPAMLQLLRYHHINDITDITEWKDLAQADGNNPFKVFVNDHSAKEMGPHFWYFLSKFAVVLSAGCQSKWAESCAIYATVVSIGLLEESLKLHFQSIPDDISTLLEQLKNDLKSRDLKHAKMFIAKHPTNGKTPYVRQPTSLSKEAKAGAREHANDLFECALQLIDDARLARKCFANKCVGEHVPITINVRQDVKRMKTQTTLPSSTNEERISESTRGNKTSFVDESVTPAGESVGMSLSVKDRNVVQPDDRKSPEGMNKSTRRSNSRSRSIATKPPSISQHMGETSTGKYTQKTEIPATTDKDRKEDEPSKNIITPPIELLPTNLETSASNDYAYPAADVISVSKRKKSSRKKRKSATNRNAEQPCVPSESDQVEEATDIPSDAMIEIPDDEEQDKIWSRFNKFLNKNLCKGDFGKKLPVILDLINEIDPTITMGALTVHVKEYNYEYEMYGRLATPEERRENLLFIQLVARISRMSIAQRMIINNEKPYDYLYRTEEDFRSVFSMADNDDMIIKLYNRLVEISQLTILSISKEEKVSQMITIAQVKKEEIAAKWWERTQVAIVDRTDEGITAINVTPKDIRTNARIMVHYQAMATSLSNMYAMRVTDKQGEAYSAMISALARNIHIMFRYLPMYLQFLRNVHLATEGTDQGREIRKVWYAMSYELHIIPERHSKISKAMRSTESHSSIMTLGQHIIFWNHVAAITRAQLNCRDLALHFALIAGAESIRMLQEALEKHFVGELPIMRLLYQLRIDLSNAIVTPSKELVKAFMKVDSEKSFRHLPPMDDEAVRAKAKPYAKHLYGIALRLVDDALMAGSCLSGACAGSIKHPIADFDVKDG